MRLLHRRLDAAPRHREFAVALVGPARAADAGRPPGRLRGFFAHTGALDEPYARLSAPPR